MGMQFTVDVTGQVTLRDLDASGLGIDADEALSNELGYTGNVEFEDAEVYDGSVTIKARARMSDYEVSASDLSNFDGEQALSESVDSYSASFEHVEFEVTDSPTGFETVEEALGDRDQAIEVYAALDKAGFEVS